MRAYAWSSFLEYLPRPTRRAVWLGVDRLLGEHGIPRDRPAGRQMFEQPMEDRRRAEDQKEPWAPMRRGWCLGDETLRKELLAQVALRLRRETTMTPAWIAGRLQMGSVNPLKNTLELATSRD